MAYDEGNTLIGPTPRSLERDPTWTVVRSLIGVYRRGTESVGLILVRLNKQEFCKNDDTDTYFYFSITKNPNIDMLPIIDNI